MLRGLGVATLGCLLVVNACGFMPASELKQGWNQANNPLNLGSGYERHLERLAKSGQLSTLPWSDTYWPNFQGGIALRWNSGYPDGFHYQPLPRESVQKLTLAQLASLSPAEKFDIYTGRFDYPVLANERHRTNPNRPTWEGICHGWAPAAINYSEPKAVLAVGNSGIQVPFGSGDVKALLDLFAGNFSGNSSHWLASRCDTDLKTHPEAANRPECMGVNPGSFHIVLANFIAVRNQALIANIFRSGEIWNQPVYGFDTRVTGYHQPSRGAAPGTTQEAEVVTQMYYTAEMNPSWDAVLGTANEIVRSATYYYRLELNAEGEIIGGAWLQEDRPGFLWTEDKVAFSGLFAPLEVLYEQSISAQQPLPNPSTGA